MDELVIFAGACQSHYEEIIKAGANFASSPHRILMLYVGNDDLFLWER